TGLGHVALISIGGGDRDLEVALPLTRIDSGLTLPRNALWASASHVRNAWASTDHRCIVWCKQLVIALCRSLFSTAAAGRSDAQSVVVEFRRHLLPSTPAGLNSILKSAKPASDESGRHRSIRFERDKLSRPCDSEVLFELGRSSKSQSAASLAAWACIGHPVSLSAASDEANLAAGLSYSADDLSMAAMVAAMRQA
uniref:Rav1p_C domain-containing protein n=1 Tax=Macrostomum lignano TaxID=282301 RepID=A0A1I8FJ01_9PLAT